MSEVLKQQDGYRVRLELDESPEQPYDDGQSPILLMTYRNGWHAEHVDPGTHRPRDCDADIQRAAEHFGSDFDRLEYYLRAFHGVTKVEQFDTRDNDHYFSYDDKAWRDKVGAPEGSASLEEWQAYVEGDVYGYVIEKRVNWTADADEFDDRESWESVESCWGFYGEKYATEEATEAFDLYTRDRD